MRFLFRWLLRAVLGVFGIALLLLLPVGYIELACQKPTVESNYQPVITDPAWQRPESRTLMTYPEWHIVHAYDEFAKVISTGDPHEFGYVRSIVDFWTTLCPLAERSAELGGFNTTSKMTIYTIGVSFSAELLAKAAYEETLGRVATLLRGENRAVLDDIYAAQAAEYALYLHQTPWYYRDFRADRTVLQTAGGESFRDQERRIAIGLEYGVKAAYGDILEAAVAATGEDATRMQVAIAGLTRDQIEALPDVAIVEEAADFTIVETERYRIFTRLAAQIAAQGAEFVEIAGNDDIMFTALSNQPTHPDAIFSFARQGYGDFRHLVVVPVASLADRLRNMGGLRLEHIHDY
ncbi:MAG: hypothetical protein AAF222_02910 [Pseudomonadota bacterium]